ncbi:MAG: peptidyl-prolyl cis-trans isomerase [Pyrinomonadaceae bacterium]
MRYFKRVIFLSLAALLFSIPAFSQETQTRVIDEVVAQVNDGVITLSRVKREAKNAVAGLIQDGKNADEAQKIVDEKQGELIAGLINDELLVQKAKESGIDVEASLNMRFRDIMKQYDLKTVEELYAQMEKSGVDPKQLREDWRKQATRDRVIEKEVQMKVYWEPNGKALKDYYEKNKAKFTTPETVSFSEIFLGFAGRDEKSVRDKAKQVYDELKAGGNWEKIAKENSDQGVITNGAGKAEKLRVKEIVDVIGKPLAGLKAGEYTAPFDVEQLGIAILRVDDRQQASSESVFDENAVRMSIMNEKLPDEQKKFMAKLRENSYIKISDTYRPLVAPILFADERKDKPAK